MPIDNKNISKLRAQTGAAILECKKALEESAGDINKAIEYLRKQGQKVVAKKAGRETGEGLVHAYIHANGKIGAMVEVLCETDFVARNEEFRRFVHDLALHIASENPLYLKPEDVPEEVISKEREIIKEQMANEVKPENVIEKIIEGKINKYYEETCLLKQPFVKDDSIIIEDFLNQMIAKMGENIQIKRFVRFSLT